MKGSISKALVRQVGGEQTEAPAPLGNLKKSIDAAYKVWVAGGRGRRTLLPPPTQTAINGWVSRDEGRRLRRIREAAARAAQYAKKP